MIPPENPAAPQLTLLCPLDALPEGSSKGFKSNNIFAVNHRGKVYLYRNSCSHLGIPLEWVENEFLDSSGSMIQCANHGALFVIHSGQCVSGPCTGRSLQAIPYQIINNCIWISQP
ncbi:Rieske (2Fe-2S) protein [Cellvibrio mixtus]|uniref:Rieske (2Fe-2S) protein n=1 Tax=Cellvibrio mixtus TaxID=39650 RepID=UPI0006933F9F|nr:Rieske 2Fe-2S domain-containing protein [Cellvibrio mixtus]